MILINNKKDIIYITENQKTGYYMIGQTNEHYFNIGVKKKIKEHILYKQYLLNEIKNYSNQK